MGLSAFLFLTKNLNLGIDFKGGIMVEAKFSEAPNLAILRDKIDKLQIGNLSNYNYLSPWAWASTTPPPVVLIPGILGMLFKCYKKCLPKIQLLRDTHS